MLKKLLYVISILLITFFLAVTPNYSQRPYCDGTPIQDMTFKVDYATYQPYAGSYDVTYSNTTYYYSWYLYTMPFTFCYDNAQYNQVYYVGDIKLMFYPTMPGASAYPYYYLLAGYYNYYTYPGINNTCKSYISAWGGFPYYYYAPADRNYGVKVLGSAPNRVVVFEWYHNVYHFDASNPITCQIRLYETSGKIEFHYDEVRCGNSSYFDYFWEDGNGYGYWWYYYLPLVALCGKDGPVNTTNYMGTDMDWMNMYPPGAAGNTTWEAHYASKDQGAFGPFPSVRTATVVNSAWAQRGLRITFGKGNPEIVNTIPTKGQILRKGQIYGGTEDEENHPAVFVFREASMPAVKILYQIYGPGLKTDFGSQVIYRAKDPVNNTFEVNPGNIIGDSTRYNFTAGQGYCFGAGGTLDLMTNGNQFKPGEYYVDASLNIQDVGYEQYALQKFNISLAYDLALFTFKPKRKEDKKYPFASTPVEMEVKNFGINSVTHFEVYVRILFNGQVVGDTLYKEWEDTEDSLKAGQSVILKMGYFYPDKGVGTYELEAWLNLLDATDQDLTTNIVPRTWETDYEVAIAKEVDIRAVKIVRPNATNPVTVGRPMIPVARFTNQGVNDLDYDTVFFWITNSANEVIYRDTIKNYVISAGARFDTTDISAKKFFVAPSAGQYTIYAKIVAPYDDNPPSMKQTSAQFTAEAGMSGDKVVGSGGDYATLQEAINDLYTKGVSGHLRFILKDAVYNIGDTNFVSLPALDLTAYIPGMGPNATVTFKPSNERANIKGGVTINLLTGSGIGILFGQNYNPVNPNAIVNYVTPSQKAKYSNSAGYFIFDGGLNKSLKFVVKTPRNTDLHFHNAFYFQQGAQNITIKNCIIENDYKNAAGSNRTLHVYLPKLKTQGTQVVYQENNYYTETSYSAAIAMRAVAPLDPSQTNSQYNLDTIPVNNNTIMGNEISGFGYGIVDLGAGVLLRTGHNKWVKYYNYGNKFINNIIKNVARAGIYLGYTDGELVKGNRIYNVSGNYYLFDNFTSMGFKRNRSQNGWGINMDAAGIMAGGDYEDGWYGFNNVNLTIQDNEISNVQSEYLAYGIKVEQSKNEFGSGNYFPDVKESTKIFNNIIWGMTAKNNDPSISRIGIRVFTQRVSDADFLEAVHPTYFTQDDRVFSNTVIMPDDGGSTSGALAGIAVQHSKATKIMNNAVAVLDNLIDASSPASALIFYQGLLPSATHGLESNRNAFYRPNPSNVNGAAIYGFVEMNAEGDFIDPKNALLFDQNAYETLRQWRNWTGQDMNSVFGDFTQDLATVTKQTVNYLRIKTPRPTGSILNDRGYRLNEYLSDNTSGYNYDALGNQRGVNGQLFDIGAEEFDGQMYLSDVEFVMISEPAAYKSGSGLFSDAEHIMTTLPIKLKAIFRNSGNLYQAGVKVRLIVEDLDVNTDMRYYDTVTTDIIVSQSREVVFDIPTNLIKTYAELEELGFNPNIPARYNPSMKANVTPRYRFTVEVQADENNTNNAGETVIRFYIRKSEKNLMLISGEYTNVDLESMTITKDMIAGKLNYEALKTGFEAIGWYPGINHDIDHPGTNLDSFKIDVFDRLAWEPKAVDYRMYKYVFWSDRDDDDGLDLNQISRYQQWDIAEFLEAGTTNNKRNLVISSQEAVRNIDFSTNNPLYDDKSSKFVRDHLRSINNGYAFGQGNDCSGKKLKGVAVGRDIVHTIQSTGFTNDKPPYVGSITMYTEGEGLARASFIYPEATTNPDKQKSGMAITNLTRNVIYIGVDWRHFDNPENVLRAILDFYDKNGGTEVPIELISFDAKSIGNKVSLRWTTASEFNSMRFEVERAEVKGGIKGVFHKIAEKEAAGQSSIEREYGPIYDENVRNGGVYVYRLKLVDIDGSYGYSDERLVEVGGNSLWLGEAVPNPSSDKVSFEITTADREVSIMIYDMNGKRVEAEYEIHNGKLEIDLSGYSTGTYTMLLRAGEVTMARQFRVVK